MTTEHSESEQEAQDPTGRDTDLLAAVENSIRDIAQSLEVDGYRLSIDGMTRNTLRASIEALDGACEECLVPKRVMEGIVLHAIPDSSGVASVQFTYPGEAK